MQPKRILHPRDDQPRQQLKGAPQIVLGREIDDESPLLKIPLLRPRSVNGSDHKAPVKRSRASIHDYEQEQKLACLSGSRNDSPGSERFDDSDKFRQLLGKSRRETFTHLLNPQSYIDMTGSLYGALSQIRLKTESRHLPSLETWSEGLCISLAMLAMSAMEVLNSISGVAEFEVSVDARYGRV